MIPLHTYGKAFLKIVNRYELDIKGVIHIGAHYGQEYSAYERLGVKNMMFFEPVSANYEKLMETLPENKHVRAFNIALGSEKGVKDIYIETANKGMSCSLLEPAGHLKQYPNITFDSKETVSVDRLDDIEFDRGLYNMINIDVQGYELEVFKGGAETLKSIDIIYTEVNFAEVYKNCCRVEDLDSFLRKFGFIRIYTNRATKTWGDALYLKY